MLENLDTQFTRAETDWDLDRLYQDLAKAKRRPLSPMEKLHLRGLLCGYSPSKIAKILHKKPKGVYVDLAKTLYPYLEEVVGKVDEGIGNWRNFREWLGKAGYGKIPLSDSSQSHRFSSSSSLSIATLNISNVNVVINYLKTVNIEGNEYIDFSGRVGPLPASEATEKDKPD